MKQALTTAPVADVMLYRLALASLAMIPFVVARRQRRPKKRDLLLLAALGLLEPVLYFTFEGLALQYTTAAQGGLVFALLPLSILVLTAVFRRRALSGRVWSAGFLGAAAVVAVTLGGGSQATAAPAPALGNALELLAVLSAATFTILADRLLTQYSAELVTLYQCVFGAFCFGAYGAISGEGGSTVGGPAFGYILYLGLIVTGGAYFAFNNAIYHLSSQVVAPFYALVPTFALLSAVTWNGQPLHVGLVAGIAISGVAIVLATRQPSGATARYR